MNIREHGFSDFPCHGRTTSACLLVKGKEARVFYETEALQRGWSVRQLGPIATQFYERTALSRNKAALIKRARRCIPEDQLTAEEERALCDFLKHESPIDG
jgi:predicted nuclease of restriction endonuclease-like (RecB) superfamily